MKLLHLFSGKDTAQAGVVDALRETLPGRHTLVDLSAPEGGLPPGGRTPARYRAIAEHLAAHDLVLTHGEGAMDAVMARRIFARDCPPLVHHLWPGLPVSATARMYARLALGGATRVVGIGVAGGDVTLPAPVVTGQRAPGTGFAALRADPKTVLVGTPDPVAPGLAEALQAARGARLVPVRWTSTGARAGGVAVPGAPAVWLPSLDLWVELGDSPDTLIREAQAAGLPVVTWADAQARALVSDDNYPYLPQPGDMTILARTLNALCGDRRARQAVAEANRAHAASAFGVASIARALREVYGAALQRSV